MARDYFRTTLTRTLASGAIEALGGIDVSIVVRNADGSVGAAAPVYGGPTTGVQLAQPIRTAADGNVEFWADAGAYYIQPRDVTVVPARIDNTKNYPWSAVPGDLNGIPLTQVADNIPLAKLASAVQEMMWSTGDIKPVARGITVGVNEPSGWLLCDGRAVSRSTYATLFAALSTTFGAGDGSTTFNLPDLRGRVLVGRSFIRAGETGTAPTDVDAVGDSDGLAIASRKVKHSHSRSLSIDAGGDHNHSSGNSQAFQTTSASSGGLNGDPGAQPYWPPQGFVWATSNSGNHSHGISGSIGDTAGPTDGPAWLTGNYLIKT